MGSPRPLRAVFLMSIRIGAVSYLNTKPLIYGLRKRLPHAELYLDLPSRLADQLAAGHLDVALIPSVEFLRGTELSIVSDACIACRGEVRSVQLLFNCEPSQVRTLALDEGSRTSAALAQVLLDQKYGIRPQLSTLSIDDDYSKRTEDALLIIGDRAMQVDSNRYVDTWDLGQEWQQQTGLSFVFAMWVGRTGEFLPEVSEAFQSCRSLGLSAIDEIAALEAPKYGLQESDCKMYFQDQLYFQLGEPELKGLSLFREAAIKLELVPATSGRLSLEPN